MICKKCNYNNEEKSKYCIKCGFPLKKKSIWTKIHLILSVISLLWSFHILISPRIIVIIAFLLWLLEINSMWLFLKIVVYCTIKLFWISMPLSYISLIFYFISKFKDDGKYTSRTIFFLFNCVQIVITTVLYIFFKSI